MELLIIVDERAKALVDVLMLRAHCVPREDGLLPKLSGALVSRAMIRFRRSSAPSWTMVPHASDCVCCSTIEERVRSSARSLLEASTRRLLSCLQHLFTILFRQITVCSGGLKRRMLSWIESCRGSSSEPLFGASRAPSTSYRT